MTSVDGTKTVVGLSLGTKIKSSSGIFGGAATWPLIRCSTACGERQDGPMGGGLVASQIKVKKGDFKTASMIRTGTEQQFGEQAAATGRCAAASPISTSTMKSMLNVKIDVDKAVLSDRPGPSCRTRRARPRRENR